jgi:hypothetical protein
MACSLKFHLVVLDIFFKYTTLRIVKKITQPSLYYALLWIFVILLDFVKLWTHTRIRWTSFLEETRRWHPNSRQAVKQYKFWIHLTSSAKWYYVFTNEMRTFLHWIRRASVKRRRDRDRPNGWAFFSYMQVVLGTRFCGEMYIRGDNFRNFCQYLDVYSSTYSPIKPRCFATNLAVHTKKVCYYH